MTHPAYSQTTLEVLPSAQLKAIAKSIGAIPDGDKRSKQVWVNAIVQHQIAFSPVKVAAMEAHIELVASRLESVVPDADETPATDNYVPTPRTHTDDEAFAATMGLTYDDVFGKPLGGSEWEETTPAPETNTQSLESTPQVSDTKPTPTREASVVALVAVLVFGLAFLIIKTGFTAFAWILTALLPLAVGLWGYLFPDTKPQVSINYFPQA